MITWDPDVYEGVGPGQQPRCAVPYCGRPTNSRGLCLICFKRWRRGGLEGLQERARVLELGVDTKLSNLDLDDAAELALRWAEKLLDTDSEDDALFGVLRARFVAICKYIGKLEHRTRTRRYNKKYKAKLAPEELQQLKAKHAAKERAWRAAHPEEVRERRKRYVQNMSADKRAAYLEKAAVNSRAWRAANREEYNRKRNEKRRQRRLEEQRNKLLGSQPTADIRQIKGDGNVERGDAERRIAEGGGELRKAAGAGQG